MSISNSVQKYQPVNNLTPTPLLRQGDLYFITVTTTNDPDDQSFIDRVFVMEYAINSDHNHDHNYNGFHKIMVGGGTDKRLLQSYS